MQCCVRRSTFSLANRYSALHKSIIFPRQKHCSTVLPKQQIIAILQRWLFAESVGHITKKGSNTGKNKHLEQNAVSKQRMEQSPDFLIAGLRDIYQKRLTIQSDVFTSSILLPLESKNDYLIEFLRRSGDIHVPFLLSLCGLPMSDATSSVKSALADRLWRALIHADIPVTRAAMKSRLMVLIENEQAFDAVALLKEAETVFDLEPDEELFTLLLQELSMTENVAVMNSMIKEIERRNLSVNMEMKAHQIYCYFKNGDSSAHELVQSAVMEYGCKIEPLIFMARCKTAIEKRDIQNFKLLLESVSSSDLSQKLLNDEMVMKFVWLLARSSTDSMGKNHEQLCTETLLKVRKDRGFFKLMVREANRHAVHGMFYSALSYFHSDLHSSVKSFFKNDLGLHMDWIGCFSKALINAELSVAELKDLFTHINRNTHHAHFLLEHILFCILTHQFLCVEKALLLTLELLKILDPNCTKIHLVVPLLIRTPAVEERLKILSGFISVGYNDLNSLNAGIIRKLILQPCLGRNNTKMSKWSTEQLDDLVDIMKKHNIPEDIFYKLLQPVAVGISSIEKWLKTRNNLNKIRKYNEVLSNTLKKYVLDEEMEKIHEFVKTYSSANISQMFQPVLMLYIRKADWNILLEYIKEMCKDGSNSVHITVENILFILARHLEEFKSVNMTSDFVYYLQQLVPKDLHSRTRNQKALRILIQKSLKLPHETFQSFIVYSQLFRTLAEVKWVQSGNFEIISTPFISTALKKFGFDEALKVCNFFRFSDFPNGIIYLLHYAIRIGNESFADKALAVARTYWPEWKVSVISIAIMICLGKLSEASCLLRKTNIRWINVFQTYQLLCTLHFDEACNFHFNYLKLFSEALGYTKCDEAFIRLTVDCLRNCTRKDPDQTHLVEVFLKGIGL